MSVMPEAKDAAAPREAVPGTRLPDSMRAPPPGGYPGGREPPSILILTLDEEVNIADCLETLSFSDDIVVLDSFSSDRTLEIARQFPNVRVVQRKFDTWSRHSNWALDNIEFKHPWVYYSDADERVPDDLREEILTKVNAPNQPHGAFRLRFKNMFMGRWLRRGGLYPVWVIRLFRPDAIRYEDRTVNPHPNVKGSLGDLASHFIHYSFNKGLLPWFHKHNKYSDGEAGEAVKVIAGTTVWDKIPQLRSKEKGVARRAFKDLSFFLRFRGFIRFLYMYFVKGALLDGRAGFHYACMISMYEYWIELKMVEQRKAWRDRTEDEVARLLREPGANAASATASAPAQSPSATPAPAQPAPPEPWRTRGTLPDGSPLVNVMIPTFNERAHIAQCVRNALEVGPVFVLDSFSTDGTQDLARAAGATVIEHPFENYSRQKNWGLDNLPLTAPWTFILDADERITPSLRDEILRVARDPGAKSGYLVNRVVLFMGRQIRHGGLFPSWNLRFFKRGACRYEDRSVHEHMLCAGEVGRLRDLMLHIRRESISKYLEKHIRYADMESEEWYKSHVGKGGGARAESLFRDSLRYRQWLRRKVWPWLPFKPLIRIVYMYAFRLGFLDGAAGWHLACLMANYEYMIGLLFRDKVRASTDRAALREREAARLRATQAKASAGTSAGASSTASSQSRAGGAS
jgi:glycosyltransferase involved in cell wall biosynthesis